MIDFPDHVQTSDCAKVSGSKLASDRHGVTRVVTQSDVKKSTNDSSRKGRRD
jgi:hypothetical protein